VAHGLDALCGDGTIWDEHAIHAFPRGHGTFDALDHYRERRRRRTSGFLGRNDTPGKSLFAKFAAHDDGDELITDCVAWGRVR
jgi:hypothetical protein